MDVTGQFLDQILRWSLLSKHEKCGCKEEMQNHLYNSILYLKEQGYSEEKATEISIRNFGDPIELRKRFTKETYGLSSKAIISLSTVSLSLFLISFFYMIFKGTGNVISSLFSPSLYLTLFICSSYLCKTRKWIDRVCLFITPIPFVVSYLIDFLSRVFPSNDYVHPILVDIIMSSVKGVPRSYGVTMSPLYLLGLCFLFVFGCILYSVSKNKHVSTLPIVLCIGYATWTIIRSLLRFVYLSAIHSPTFILHQLMFFDFYFFLWFLIKLSVLIALILVNHFLNKRLGGSRNTTPSF